MKIIPVNSSNIIALGYDVEKFELTVQFKGDSWYRYYDVDAYVVASLVFHESPGTYLNDAIKGHFQFSKLDEAPADAHV